MSTEQPVCHGCYLQPLQQQIQKAFPDIQWGNPPVVRESWGPSHNLTGEEAQILYSLADAWNRFVALDKKHPDDNDDFRRAIHQAQQLIAMRVARRVDPEVWLQPEA